MNCPCNKKGIQLQYFWLKFRTYRKNNFLSDAREFHDPDAASSSGDTRITMGTSGSDFEGQPAREGPSSSIFENSKNLASSFGWKGIREPQSSAIPTPHFNQGAASLNPHCHIGGTFSLFGMMVSDLGNASRKIPWLNGVSKLERQLQVIFLPEHQQMQ